MIQNFEVVSTRKDILKKKLFNIQLGVNNSSVKFIEGDAKAD
jgi:hypothetical protein